MNESVYRDILNMWNSYHIQTVSDIDYNLNSSVWNGGNG